MCSRIIPITRAIHHACKATGARNFTPLQAKQLCTLRAAPFTLQTAAYSQGSTTSPTSESSDVQAVERSTDEEDKLYKYVEVEVRGHDPAVLKSYKWYVIETARLLDITVSDTWEPKKVHNRLTTLKSVFAKKKYLVQYEARTYFQVIQLKHLTGSTADTFLEYIQRNLPEGVAMKVSKTLIERLPEYIRPPAQSDQTTDSTRQ